LDSNSLLPHVFLDRSLALWMEISRDVQWL
jgi:hypothetical protein